MPALATGQFSPPNRASSSRVTLSSRGRSFVTVGLVSVVAGLVLGVTDLERVGVLLVALPIPAWLVVRQARAGLTVTHLATPSGASVDEPIEIKLSLGNPNAISTGPLRVTETVPGGRPLRFSVGGVRARQRRTVSYPLPALSRGRFTVGPTTIVASDPFGLVIATSVSTDHTEVIVRPKVHSLAAANLPVTWRDGSTSFSHSIGAGGSDDASVREYRYGDDLRKIHWRSTARSGAMMVRQEERPWQGDTVVLLDTRASAYAQAGKVNSDVAFEWAVSAAASVAVHLVHRKRRVTVTAGYGETAADSPSAVLDLLAETRSRTSASLSTLAAAINSAGRDATVFAVLAATGESSTSELLLARRSAGTSIAFLLDTACWPDDGSGAVAESAQWDTTARALRSGGWTVFPVRASSDLAELWSSALGGRAVASYHAATVSSSGSPFGIDQIGSDGPGR